MDTWEQLYLRKEGAERMNPNIRKAREADASRIAEIFVYNNRANFFPIFKDETYSFDFLQVTSVVEQFAERIGAPEETYVYDDGIVRGFLVAARGEVKKLYVDSFFQGRGIGAALLDFAVGELDADFLWALEKNTDALRFYARYGFLPSGERKYEDGTTEWLIRLSRSGDKQGEKR